MLIPTSPDPSAKLPTLTPAEAVAAIGRGAYRANHLEALSDLNRSDARALAATWVTIPEASRISIVRVLVEAAEEHVEYLFGRVLRIGLSDPSAVVRQMAISGLWEDESRDLIDLFLGLMVEDPSVDVRAEAASALGRFAERAAMEELNEDDSVRIRTALVDVARSDRQPDLLRRRALESLAIFGSSHGVDALIAQAFEADDSAMRASAIYAMGRSLDRRWLGTVLSEFESEDAEIRYEAARASGELGHVDAVSGLSELIDDGDVEVRQAAVAALGKIGGQGAIRVLEAYSSRCLPGDREAVLDALAEARLMNDALRGRP